MMKKTTMSEPSPWDEISVPSTDFNVRQDAAKTAVPCLWGRDASGACLFVVELQGDNTDQYRRNVVTVNGVHVDLRAGEHRQQRLVLVLERQVDRDLFEGLCRTLILALERATDSASALAISLANIRRWKAFLAGRGQQLSADGVRGLFAELLFLGELIDRKMPSKDAVDAWLGPERFHQDFIFGNTAVEVKSLSGAERNSVRISSEDQLESIGVVDIIVIPVGGNGYTLDATAAAHLVRQIDAKVVIPVHYADSGLKYEVPQDDFEVFHKELGGEVESVDKLKVKTVGTLPTILTLYKLARS